MPTRLALAPVAAALAVVAIALTGCAGAAPHPTASHRAPSPTPTPTVDPIAGLTLQQEVGQLFVAGTLATSLDPATASAIHDAHVGGIFLRGRSQAPASANLAVVQQAESASTDGIPLLVSTDQEGGQVQVLQGPGFDRMPAVINGFTGLILEVFGEERGRHARSAVGMAELPFGIPVEIEAEVEIDG